MQKLIDNVVTIFLGLVVGSFFFFAVQAKAEPPNFDQYGYRNPPTQQQQQQRQPSSDNVVNQIIEVFLQNGLSGAIIVCLFGYIYRNDRNNRESQQANIDRFSDLSIESNKILSELVAKIDGVERELEAAKTLSMMKRS